MSPHQPALSVISSSPLFRSVNKIKKPRLESRHRQVRLEYSIKHKECMMSKGVGFVYNIERRMTAAS